MPNKVLHWTGIALHFISASELGHDCDKKQVSLLDAERKLFEVGSPRIGGPDDEYAAHPTSTKR
jgi:hypothetical protein